MSQPAIRFIEPPTSDPRLIAIELDGHFTRDDMRTFMDRFEDVVDGGHPVRLYQDVSGLDGFDLGSIAEKLQHMGTLWKGLEKAAIVGDERWLEVYISVVNPITPQELKHFSTDEKDDAFRWLLE